jgi:hypothetical protein
LDALRRRRGGRSSMIDARRRTERRPSPPTLRLAPFGSRRAPIPLDPPPPQIEGSMSDLCLRWPGGRRRRRPAGW